MKRLALWFLLLVSVTASVTAQAGDSGTYFDTERNGEGIVVQRNGDLIVTFLFTYGQVLCGLPIRPQVSPEPPEPVSDCQPQGQRWFLAADEIVGNVVSGLLLQTEAVNFPVGRSGVVGIEVVVGAYTLVRDGDGWLMSIRPFGRELDDDDPLFTEYAFSTLLFQASD